VGLKRNRKTEPEPNSRRAWLIPSTLGFLAGVITWHAIGFWSFMIAIVHGFEPGAGNVTALVVRGLNPEGWKQVSERWFDNAEAVARIEPNCVSVGRAVQGLGARHAPCLRLTELRQVPGVAPKHNRQTLAAPLQATFGLAKQAPVAGWAARVADDAPKSAPDLNSTASMRDDEQKTLNRSLPSFSWQTDIASGK